MPLEHQRAADRRRLAAEFALPETVAQDDGRRRAAAAIVGRGDEAADIRADAECFEEPAVHPETGGGPRLARRRHVEVRGSPRCTAGERLLSIANLFEERTGEHRTAPAELAGAPALRFVDADLDELIGIADG